MQTILQTLRVIIRQFAEDEEELLQSIGEDERVARFITRRSREETSTLFNQLQIAYQTQPGLGRWAIINREDGDFIGLCMLLEARPGLSGTELGYALHYKYWNQGLGSEIVKAVISYGFNELNLDSMCAITSHENVPSQRVLHKNGFSYTGDVALYGTSLQLHTIKKSDQ